MSLFRKPLVVLWPKDKSVDVFLDRSENNTISLDVDLWKEQTDTDLLPLVSFLKQNQSDTCSVLIPDDIVLTKSFIYDTKIENVEVKEVIGLAESFVRFKIDPEEINYNLVQTADKTIVQARIYDKTKHQHLRANLIRLGLKSFTEYPVSEAISKTIPSASDLGYFLIYPLNSSEYTLILSKNNSVYLTANLKGPSLDIQKIVNYSSLYFSQKITKLYLPSDRELEINSTTPMDKIAYTDFQIAASLKKSSNLPLPVVGLLMSSHPPAVIIKPTDNNLTNNNMEEKKNILPIIAVFVFTASLASIIIWFILNRSDNPDTLSPNSGSLTPTPMSEVLPTDTPVPSIAAINKSLKIQVLNATDINGQAASLKGKLTTLGFTNITVGNTKEKLTENLIQLKSDLASNSAYFQSQLADYFVATITTDLKSNSTYDAVFTIGTDLSQKVSTTPSASVSTTKVTPTPLE